MPHPPFVTLPALSRRLLVQLAVTAAAAPLLAACGATAATPVAAGTATSSRSSVTVSGSAALTTGAATSGLPAPAAAAGGKPRELRFELWDNNHFDVEQQMIAAFEKGNPDYKIQVQQTVTDYLTKLETELAGNAAPDVFWLSTTFFPKMATNGTLVDLTPLVARDKVALTDYGPTYVRYFTYKDKLLAFPKDWDTVALLFNKDLFDKAGLPYPSDAWKWDPSSGGDLLENAKKLTSGSGSSAQYGLISSATAGQSFWYNFVWMNGGDILDQPWGKHVVLSSASAMDALQWCADLANKYHVSPSVGDLSSQNADQSFWAGRAAMITNGDWVLHNYQTKIGTRFKWDIAPLPTGPKGRISETNSLGYGIWSGGKQQDAAWTFTRWLGKEGEVFLAKGGAVFPAYLPAVDDFVKSLPEFNLKAYADSRVSAHPVPETPYSNQLSDELNKELPVLWEGKADVKSTVQRIVSALDPVLADSPQP